ncbi:MAG: hypothetical protein H5T69_02740, partial [Chloroflexi bacterium]|nr:hypothetical protein [Chloroflexota bacterium]
VSFDPYYLGLSRVLHIDALATGFMLVSILAALVYLRGGSRTYWAFSAIAGALAALTKTYGLVAVPAVAIMLAIGHLKRSFAKPGEPRRQMGALLGDGAIWGLVAAGAFALLWPAMWSAPLRALRTMVGLSLEYATSPGDATAAFFRGQPVTDAGPLFYPTVLLFRTMPLTVVGLVLAPVALVLARRFDPLHNDARRATMGGMLLLGLLHLALISSSGKKFDRYALPTMLAMDVIAALGLASVLDLFDGIIGSGDKETTRHPAKLYQGIALMAGIALQTGLLLAPLFPAYYLAAYNPCIGGLAAAVNVLPMGWGEGIEQAARYLSAHPDAPQLTVATWAVAGLAPTFPGHMVKLTAQDIPQADYVLLYIGDVQQGGPLVDLFYSTQKPEFVAHVAGIEYAWLYANEYHRALGREIDQTAGSDDLIVLSAPSAFTRHYKGRLPVVIIDQEEEAAVAQALAMAAPGHRDLFYVEYTGHSARAEAIRRQLAQNALWLWTEPFPLGTYSRYRLSDRARFHQVDASIRLEVAYGEQLALEGYGLSDTVVEYRQALGLGLRWRALRPPDADYHLFIHLLDERGAKWGQYDAPLRDELGQGTRHWLPNESHTGRYTLSPEPGIPPGRYRVAVGLYNLADMKRLEVRDGRGESVAGAFILGSVEVLPATIPPESDALAIPHPLSLRLGQQVEILGYGLSNERPTSGERVRVMLYWRCLERMAADYALTLELRTALGEPLAGFQPAIGAPVGEGYPTSRWAPGDVLRYAHELSIPPDAESGTYGVYLNLIDADRGQRLVAQDLLLGELAVEHRERRFEPPPIAHLEQATLGEDIRLLGYDLEEPHVSPGGTLHLTLYWQALGPPGTDYVVFTHLLDGNGLVRGQKDGVPVDGERPTSGWIKGEILIDHYEIQVDEGATPGIYRLEIGMYDPTNGERLEVILQDGRIDPDRRLLLNTSVRVGES